MISDDKYRLAFDERKKIETQYTSRLGPQTFGRYFVQHMEAKDKIVKIPWGNLNSAVRIKLAEQRFTRNSEDYKFVIVASGTCCGKLVSHEPHFFNVQSTLKQIGITVLWPNSA
jgi:hypothetical protein